jgi:hypothetical protein
MWSLSVGLRRGVRSGLRKALTSDHSLEAYLWHPVIRTDAKT